MSFCNMFTVSSCFSVFLTDSIDLFNKESIDASNALFALSPILITSFTVFPRAIDGV